MPNLPNYRRQAMGDVVPAMLEPGEFVINRNAVNALGVDNLEVLNESGGAHSNIDRLIASATVASSLQNARPPHYQFGGPVYGMQGGGRAPALTLEDIAPFKEAQQLYMEGDPKLEGGASMFAPSGGYSKDYFAQKFNIPVEEAAIDTAYYTDPANYMFNVMRGGEKVGQTSARGDILPRRSEYMGAKRELESGLREKLGSSGYAGILGELMGDEYTGLEEKVGAGYFEMDPFEQMGYDRDKSKARNAPAQQPAGDPMKKLMMESMNMSSDEYDAFMKWKESKEGMQQGGLYGGKLDARSQLNDLLGRAALNGVGVGGYRNGGPVKKKGISIGSYQDGGEVGMGLENFISRIAGEREDVTRAGIRDIMNRVAFHESAGTGQTDLAQYGGGRGTGIYQFERGAGQGGATAGNRLAAQLGIYEMKVPKWLESFNKSGKGDVSKLTRKQQDMLFVGNMMQHPQANMGKVMSGDTTLADFWQKYHQAGGEGVRDARMASFEKSMGRYPGMQQGGQVEQLEYREPPVQGNGLMGMSNDRRVMPVLPPDEYVMRQENGEMFMSKQQVPKLSTAYMAAFGMETPLSKRQRNLLQRRAINPESMSPQMRGLLGKVLLQRLGNEPE